MTEISEDPRCRFSSRVEDYVRYRPGYPAEIARKIAAHCGLKPGSVIADVGSGTGLFAEPLLKLDFKVIGIEPNAAMRRAGEQYLQDFEHFHSIDGEAADTGLDRGEIDLVTVAQAFHWFDLDAFKDECLRILRPAGLAAIVYNERRRENLFQKSYERLLDQYALGYADILKQHIDESRFRRFFSDEGYRTLRCENFQYLDLAGVKGRLKSSSYCPPEDHPHYPVLMQGLEEWFDACRHEGRICLEYDTLVFIGRPGSSAVSSIKATFQRDKFLDDSISEP